jgi:hypothetical protein
MSWPWTTFCTRDTVKCLYALKINSIQKKNTINNDEEKFLERDENWNWYTAKNEIDVVISTKKKKKKKKEEEEEEAV